MEILNVQQMFEGYEYPREFLKIVELNLIDLDFWYVMPKEQLEIRIKGLKD